MRSNLLDRHSAHTSSWLTAAQLRLDATLEGLQHQASDFKNIAAMTCAAGVFRILRAGTLSFVPGSASGVLKGVSYLGAVAGEATSFRGIHSLLGNSEERNSEAVFDRSAWLRTFGDFLALKLGGGLTEGGNVILQHAVQASSMVASRQLHARLGLCETDRRSLVEQFVEAEGTNLALFAGQKLFALAIGERFHHYERSLELGIRAHTFALRESEYRFSPASSLPVFASTVHAEGRALIAVNSVEDIPLQYRDTPVGRLLEYHNLGRPHDEYPSAAMVIGMCMDHRNTLVHPQKFAYVLRAGGANMRYNDFKFGIALTIGGANAIAIIGHTQCAMCGLDARRSTFVEKMVSKFQWESTQAEAFFDQNAAQFEIGDPMEFTLKEARRYRFLYPGIPVAPLIYRVEDNRLYLLPE